MKRNFKTVLGVLISLMLLGSGFSLSAGKWPWQRRFGKDVELHHKRQHEERVKPEMWPEEPSAPSGIDAEKFVAALRTICGEERLGPERGKKFGTAILTYAAQFDVDPFLIGGLIYDQSRCLPKQPEKETRRYGLSRIDVEMHAPHIRNKSYNYWILENGEWTLQSEPADKYPFNLWKAASPDSNIYWTAVILKVLKAQRPSLASAFANGFLHAPYRHYVSHWFFGDNVQSSEPEDRVLTARRRLIQYYNQRTVVQSGIYNGLQLVSPLDGVPRMVLDDFGRWRGKRKSGYAHNGTDFVAQLDEPIRAVADGKTVFVGVDLPNAGSKRLTAAAATRFNPRKMGAGGRYVAINHGNGLRSYYMHMDTVTVEDWSEVKAGDIIGTVGRSGSTESGPHLHLEFRTEDGRLDPAHYLQNVLVDPKTAATGKENPGKSE